MAYSPPVYIDTVDDPVFIDIEWELEEKGIINGEYDITMRFTPRISVTATGYNSKEIRELTLSNAIDFDNVPTAKDQESRITTVQISNDKFLGSLSMEPDGSLGNFYFDNSMTPPTFRIWDVDQSAWENVVYIDADSIEANNYTTFVINKITYFFSKESRNEIQTLLDNNEIVRDNILKNGHILIIDEGQGVLNSVEYADIVRFMLTENEHQPGYEYNLKIYPPANYFGLITPLFITDGIKVQGSR